MGRDKPTVKGNNDFDSKIWASFHISTCVVCSFREELSKNASNYSAVWHDAAIKLKKKRRSFEKQRFKGRLNMIKNPWKMIGFMTGFPNDKDTGFNE